MPDEQPVIKVASAKAGKLPTRQLPAPEEALRGAGAPGEPPIGDAHVHDAPPARPVDEGGGDAARQVPGVPAHPEAALAVQAAAEPAQRGAAAHPAHGEALARGQDQDRAPPGEGALAAGEAARGVADPEAAAARGAVAVQPRTGAQPLAEK